MHYILSHHHITEYFYNPIYSCKSMYNAVVAIFFLFNHYQNRTKAVKIALIYSNMFNQVKFLPLSVQYFLEDIATQESRRFVSSQLTSYKYYPNPFIILSFQCNCKWECKRQVLLPPPGYWVAELLGTRGWLGVSRWIGQSGPAPWHSVESSVASFVLL